MKFRHWNQTLLLREPDKLMKQAWSRMMVTVERIENHLTIRSCQTCLLNFMMLINAGSIFVLHVQPKVRPLFVTGCRQTCQQKVRRFARWQVVTVPFGDIVWITLNMEHRKRGQELSQKVRKKMMGQENKGSLRFCFFNCSFQAICRDQCYQWAVWPSPWWLFCTHRPTGPSSLQSPGIDQNCFPENYIGIQKYIVKSQGCLAFSWNLMTSLKCSQSFPGELRFQCTCPCTCNGWRFPYFLHK